MPLICRIAELRHKEVINRANGCRIGFVDDVEIDTCTSQIKSVIVFGRPKFMGFFGRFDDIIIPWRDIELIGEDTILVSSDVHTQQKKRERLKVFS